MFSVVYK